VLAAVRSSGGAIVSVSDDEIREAQATLARSGLFVEPTSAAAIAGLPHLADRIGPDETAVVPLTGSGLKAGLIWNTP
jgi:threonine synthase